MARPLAARKEQEILRVHGVGVARKREETQAWGRLQMRRLFLWMTCMLRLLQFVDIASTFTTILLVLCVLLVVWCVQPISTTHGKLGHSKRFAGLLLRNLI